MRREEVADLLSALSVTAEVMGATMSDAAARVMASDLADYPLPAVLAALHRVRRECKYRMTLAEIVERIDDGRPGPEEAWSMVPTSERQTAVLTDEIAACIPTALLERGEMVAARMAFVEAYRRSVAEARAAKAPVRWFASLGHDVAGREKPLRDAERMGRLTTAAVQTLLPGPSEAPRLPSAVTLAIKRLKAA